MLELTDVIKQMDLIFHQSKKEKKDYTFFVQLMKHSPKLITFLETKSEQILDS